MGARGGSVQDPEREVKGRPLGRTSRRAGLRALAARDREHLSHDVRSEILRGKSLCGEWARSFCEDEPGDGRTSDAERGSEVIEERRIAGK